jgi:hypothetical protein
MFQNSVLGFSLMSLKLIEFLTVKISLLLVEIKYDIKCNKNREKL